MAMSPYEKDVIKYLKSINKELEKLNKSRKEVKIDADVLAGNLCQESVRRGY